MTLRTDPLSSVLKMTSSAMEANQQRLQTAAENMANSRSANFAPKEDEFRTRLNRKDGTTTLEHVATSRNSNRIKQVYMPEHPQANADGFVSMPDIDPIVEMVNITQAKQDTERLMRAYEAAVDLKHKTIRMMGGG